MVKEVWMTPWYRYSDPITILWLMFKVLNTIKVCKNGSDIKIAFYERVFSDIF